MPEIEIPEFGVAITGMAARFPGAHTIDEYWKNLCAGVESVSFFSDDEIDPSVNRELLKDSKYVRARGILDNIDKFDASFFGFSTREAETMDPQQRVFLELGWEALENAGYDPDRFKKPIGVYAGMNNNTYYQNNVLTRRDRIDMVGDFQAMLLNEKDFLTTRLSYKLNLKGPSLNIYTACSTSLVAVCSAFEALLTYQCDMALAGGVSIIVPQKTGYVYNEGAILSADGHCRPFDSSSSGTTFGCGAGLVVLRRIEDALRDGDQIYAIIKGVGVNNDGGDKVSFTAPSVQGQAGAIAAALAQSEVPAETITYIETHGTATPLGDPIEIEALNQAFGATTSKKQFCAIGSVKGNFGHLVHAAGIAGLIKTVLSLKKGMIPPTIHYKNPNPQINFEQTPFFVNASLRPWQTQGFPRRAGVSSFGVGGTNAHVILEEAPATVNHKNSGTINLLPISARTPTALDAATENLQKALLQGGDLTDIAFTLQNGRRQFNHRRVVVGKACKEVSDILQSMDPRFITTGQTDATDRDVAFLFPGQGSQYYRMGASLYEQEPAFRSTVDQCADLLKKPMGIDIRDILFNSKRTPEDAAAILGQTQYTQPALFTIEYALAQLWMSWNIVPVAMLGHSIGEFVAACIAGIFSLTDALMLVATRGKMMQEMPKGTMLSVRTEAAKLEPLLPATVNIAAINSPANCVAAGPSEAIGHLEKILERQNIPCKPLHTSHAFHSSMMDPIIEPFLTIVRSITLTKPSIPIVSSATGVLLTDNQAIDPEYWAKHLRATVKFSPAITELWKNQDLILLEVGPRAVATTLAKQNVRDQKKRTAIASLGDSGQEAVEYPSLYKAIGSLWIHGKAIQWKKLYPEEKPQRVALPTYPFERKSYWIEPGMPAAGLPSGLAPLTLTIPQIQGDPMPNPPVITGAPSRKDRLLAQVRELFETTSGEDLPPDNNLSFFEIGFDSLALTQAAMAVKQKFKVNIAFRQLSEEFSTINSLVSHLDNELPAESIPQVAMSNSSLQGPVSTPTTMQIPGTMAAGTATGAIQQVIAQQLQLMQHQLEMLGMPPLVAGGAQTTVQTPITPSPSAPQTDQVQEQDTAKAFVGPALRITKTQSDFLTPRQSKHLQDLIKRYCAHTAGSKKFTQQYRKTLADPRAASGFTPKHKEFVYPIVVNRSLGCRLWDIDGNEYIDMLNGFGSNFFGYRAPFVIDALRTQLDQGIEIGPQHPLAGELSVMLTEFLGHDRVAFCNTGSEAVLGCMRIARTVTGRDKIAMFVGAYHGIFDEVIVKGTKKLKSLPAAPGIQPGAVENILVLDYGTPETLEILKNRAHELAAILVEPVQSRLPELQPKEFLLELRKLTEQSETAFIVDEVVTGFRTCPGGAQEYFGFKADLASYGKVLGGGMNIGVIAGKSKYMDALDGGQWSFGDESIPEVGVTYFAGTFVRHPPVLAAAKAVVQHLKSEGPQLQQKVNERTTYFVNSLNRYCETTGVPLKLTHFASVVRVAFTEEVPYGELLFLHLREKGVHIWDHRPCFLTTAHTDQDIEFVINAFKESVKELRKGEFLPEEPNAAAALDASKPPHSDARLGRDREGNPAWFVPDPDRPGKYVPVERNI